MKILLTGGSASGKSIYGKILAQALPGPHYYLDTMRPYQEDSLMEAGRHATQRRPEGFTVLPCFGQLSSVPLPETGTVLLECLCNMTANLMFGDYGTLLPVRNQILEDIRILEKHCSHLIVITNEVGSEAQSYEDLTPDYVQLLGELNTALAKEFDCVYEMVCGIPVALKGALPDVSVFGPCDSTDIQNHLIQLSGEDSLLSLRHELLIACHALPRSNNLTLIIGGAASGKLAYAKTLGYSSDDISESPDDHKPVLNNLQDLIASDPHNSFRLMDLLLKKEVIICNEVGCGVVPLEPSDRDARLQTGRLCILLAKQARKVVRMVSGIPVILKEKG